jgi:hypothetical protein
MAGPVQKEIADLSAKLANYPNGVSAVSGWLIETAGGNSKLYVTPELDEWLEFPPAAIVYKKELQDCTDPWPRTMVWLNNDSAIEHVRSDAVKAQEDFLFGEISKSVDRLVSPSLSQETLRVMRQFVAVIDWDRLRTSTHGCSTVPLCSVCGG